jgi:hypothetical protein
MLPDDLKDKGYPGAAWRENIAEIKGKGQRGLLRIRISFASGP